jgi:hypothetical protein
MHFAYEGFTHDGYRRCFLFRGIDESNPVSMFSIEVDLSLFAQNHVPVQDGPTFCLQLLTTALLAGTNYLDRFHKYRVIGEDFRPMLIERERRAAEKALKKSSRKPFRKPSFASNLHLGIPRKER